MAGKRILTVIGATGNQGGSVIRAVLGDPETKAQFQIRAVTRDPQSKKAQALTEQGVECVKADLDDKSHLLPAFKDAYAVFGVTNYWEKADPKVEYQQGKNIADAAKESGVQHLIFSSLLNVTTLSNGEFSDVPHFDTKAAIEDYIREIGVPATFVLPGFYMSNIPGALLRKQEDGAYAFTGPFDDNAGIPLFDADGDTGKFVKAALKKRDQLLGKRLYEATAYYTPWDIVTAFQNAFPNAGKGARYNKITGEQQKQGMIGMGMPEAVANELTQNFLFMSPYGYFGKEPLEPSISFLDENPTKWEDFVKKAKAFSELD